MAKVRNDELNGESPWYAISRWLAGCLTFSVTDSGSAAS
jgi:hypothetical protein